MVITFVQAQEAIAETQKRLLTSNDIVSRTQQPYYHSHPSVPPVLTEFKRIITEIRTYASSLINELGVQPAGSTTQDFRAGAFFHGVLLGLVMSSFGIGECAESTYILAEQLVRKEKQNLLFVSLLLPARSTGMEMGHALLIANIRECTEEMRQAETLSQLLCVLPGEAIVADAFLGLCYSPQNGFPLEMRQYIDAYGGQERITSIQHFYNFSKTVLTDLQLKAVSLIKKMRDEHSIVTQKPFDLSTLYTLSEDTRLLEMLKEKTPLLFSGYRDDDYYVYALATLSKKTDWLAALQLKAYLPEGSVTFFRGPTNPQKQSVIIHHINETPISCRIDSFNKRI